MNLSHATLTFNGGTLRLEGVAAGLMDKVFRQGMWKWDPRDNAWRCDGLHYSSVRETLQAKLAEGSWSDTAPQWHSVQWPKPRLPKLRPEQQAAAERWMATRRGVVVMPTGTGKTEVALAAMLATSVSTLVVSPVRDLMHQWHRRIYERFGYDAGLIGDNAFHVRPVSCTTYDSACIHMERLGNLFGLVIFDECHHLPSAARAEAARMCAAPMRLGLTATPERADGRHVDLETLIGPLAFDLSMAEVRGKTLADYETVRIPVYLTDEEQARYDWLSEQVRRYIVERRREDPKFTWQDLCADSAATAEARRALRAFREKKAIEDRAAEKLRVLEDLFCLHAGEPALVFAGSNAMAREVSLRFLIPSLLSHTRKRERREILQGLERGEFPAIVANQVLDEGVDLPDVKLAIVLGGLGSTRQAKQRLGRVLRRCGNARAVLYEVVCGQTNEEKRSRRRRRSDAYVGTRHRRI